MKPTFRQRLFIFSEIPSAIALMLTGMVEVFLIVLINMALYFPAVILWVIFGLNPRDINGFFWHISKNKKEAIKSELRDFDEVELSTYSQYIYDRLCEKQNALKINLDKK